MQSANPKICLVGYSGHGYVVAESLLLNEMSLLAYAEPNETDQNPYRFEYLGSEADENYIGRKDDYEFALGIGNNRLRQKIGRSISARGHCVVNAIHPMCSVAPNSSILDKSVVFIGRGASVNSLGEIGAYAVINTSAAVDHECTIGEAAHICPGAVLCGNVSIGERSFVGANSAIKPEMLIGYDVTIGAGSVVINDVEPDEIVFGNPAKERPR